MRKLMILTAVLLGGSGILGLVLVWGDLDGDGSGDYDMIMPVLQASL